jgi:hypothetical protein
MTGILAEAEAASSWAHRAGEERVEWLPLRGIDPRRLQRRGWVVHTSPLGKSAFAPQQDEAAHQDEDQEEDESDQVENQPE